MYDQLRKALLAVCKRFADGCAIEETELKYLRKELKRFTGALTDNGDHELFMKVFNFGTMIHDSNPGRPKSWADAFGTISDDNKDDHEESDPFFDYKSYPQEKKIKLLQILTQELLELLIANETDNAGLLVQAPKIMKDLRILFRLVPHTSWHNEADKKSVLDDLYIIYTNLDNNGWETPAKPSVNVQKGITKTSVDKARKLVEKVNELAPENVFLRTLVLSGKCFASGLRFFKSKTSTVVPVEIKSNILYLPGPGKRH